MRQLNVGPVLWAVCSLVVTGLGCGDDEDMTPMESGMSGLTTVRTGSLMADGPGGAPDATGDVSIGRDADGQLFVVLADDFMQEMGPGDTQVILARGPDNVDQQRSADAANTSPSLGVVANGFAGGARYSIPASVDVDSFSHLIIWCPTAEVNFGVAELSGAGSSSPETVLQGDLVADGAGGAPDATGTVLVQSDDSGSLSVVLGEDFMQEMGPGDTQLLFAEDSSNVEQQRAADPSSVSAVLGTIPNGASGSRSFEVPSGVSVDDFDFVIVWCPTAEVNFGVAELQ